MVSLRSLNRTATPSSTGPDSGSNAGGSADAPAFAPPQGPVQRNPSSRRKKTVASRCQRPRPHPKVGGSARDDQSPPSDVPIKGIKRGDNVLGISLAASTSVQLDVGTSLAFERGEDVVTKSFGRCDPTRRLGHQPFVTTTIGRVADAAQPERQVVYISCGRLEVADPQVLQVNQFILHSSAEHSPLPVHCRHGRYLHFKFSSGTTRFPVPQQARRL